MSNNEKKPEILVTTSGFQMVGYNPIERIRGAMFHMLPVPFNGHPVWCYCRCLNYTQLMACGDISLISLKKKDEEEKKPDLEAICDMKNVQEAITIATLIEPSYDEILKVVTGEDFVISRKKKELEELQKLLDQTTDSKEKRELTEEIRKYEIFLGFLLPDDTMGFLTAWATGRDVTDIEKLSRHMLLDAALLAKNGSNDPSDHIVGVFTDFQREDINKCAWIVYNDYCEEKKIEEQHKKSGFKWVGGKKDK